jgi:ABC-type sugar transport system ATPase subunit
VELVEPVGAEAYLHARIGGIAIVARVPPTTDYAPGAEVALEFDLGEASLFEGESGVALA